MCDLFYIAYPFHQKSSEKYGIKQIHDVFQDANLGLRFFS